MREKGENGAKYCLAETGRIYETAPPVRAVRVNGASTESAFRAAGYPDKQCPETNKEI